MTKNQIKKILIKEEKDAPLFGPLQSDAIVELEEGIYLRKKWGVDGKIFEHGCVDDENHRIRYMLTKAFRLKQIRW
jgi:hypothetical protein